ncbi:MAG: methyltransferase family protein [Deltaproteobacteria bacterium]
MAGKIRFKKLRLWLVYPAFVVYPFVARFTDATVSAGSLILVAGAAVRLWAAGYLIKSHHLTTCGPYAYTRNPLYLGNFLVGLGVAAMSGNALFILYYVVSFYLLYAGTIREEETDLRRKFGKDFDDYAVSVPPFFPAPFGFRAREKRAFSWAHVKRNGELIRLSGFGALLAFLHLAHVGVSDHAWNGPYGLTAGLLFVLFLGLLWLNISIRRKAERTGGSSKDRLRAALGGKEPK